MLVENQIIVTKWHPRNKEHLESKGYIYTRIGEEVSVRLEDMKEGSKCKVRVICDYCGEECLKTYKDYFRQRKESGKDACKKCHEQKAMHTNQERYGGPTPMSSEEIKEKMSCGFMEKYGVAWVTQAAEIQRKIEDTYMAKYGTKRASQSEAVKNKMIATNLERFGGRSSQCSVEVREKSMRTKLANDTIPSSRPEREMICRLQKMYGSENCYPQFVLDKIAFDCLLKVNDVLIDVEFDGNYWHQDTHKDIRRDYFTINQGFKVLRFRGNHNSPTYEQIQQGVNYLVNSEHRHIIIEV